MYEPPGLYLAPSVRPGGGRGETHGGTQQDAARKHSPHPRGRILPGQHQKGNHRNQEI